MQIAISPSTLNLPFILGQDLAAFKIWLELIPVNFSNKIRTGCYCLNPQNSKHASLCAEQKLKPGICPLAAHIWREWWQLAPNEWENKYTDISRLDRHVGCLLSFWLLIYLFFSHLPMEKGNQWMNIQIFSVCLESWQSSRNTIRYERKVPILTSLGYHFSLFTEGRPKLEWAVWPLGIFMVLLSVLSYWSVCHIVQGIKVQRGVRPCDCPQGAVTNQSFSFLTFACPRHLS